MEVRLIAAWPLERYQLWLTFADGTEGPVDLEDEVPGRTLEPIRDLALFRRAAVDRGCNCLVWPNAVRMDCSGFYRNLRRRRHRPARWRRG